MHVQRAIPLGWLFAFLKRGLIHRQSTGRNPFTNIFAGRRRKWTELANNRDRTQT